MSSEALSSIDRMWFQAEDPTHPMMITVLLVFNDPIEFERLQRLLRHRLLQFSRLCQHVVHAPDGSVHWQEDASFDLDHQLKRIDHPPPGDEGALRTVVGELMSEQLDFSRPLWQFHLVESYGAGCALVGRVHHCLADGPALMQVLLALTDMEPNGAPTVDPVQVVRSSPLPLRGVAAQVSDLLARQGHRVLTNPMHLVRLARLGAGTMTVMSKLIGRSPDPGTILRGKLGIPKRVAWSEPLALVEVQALGRAVEGTINDVMLAVAAGALRRYLQSHGEPVQGLAIRAGLSVNLRQPDAELSLGNQAGAVLVDLPVGIEGALERLGHVKRRMDAIKDSPEASVVWGLLNALGKAPAEIQEALSATYVSRDTIVIANIPGPGETVYLAGAPLSAPMFWVPALGGTGLCLSIVSYDGQVWFGAGTDQGLVPDPENLIAGFQAEFDALKHAVHDVAPDWDRPVEPPASFETMNAMLDEALAKLDALLEDKEPGS